MTGVANPWRGASNIRTVDSWEVKCCGETDAKIVIRNILLVIVLDKLITGIKVILGLDAINQLEEATIAKGQVKFRNQYVTKMARGANSNDTIQLTKPKPYQIEDFQAHFDGDKWTAEWRCTTGLPMLMNRIGCYKSTLRGEIKAEFEKEVERWIDKGILILWSGKVEGILLPIAMVQPSKKKVRLVLDIWELNKYVACHTRDEINVCEEVMREWRRIEGATKIVDLKLTYLQIHVDKKLWQYQLVEYKDQIYCLTRLGFGLSSAPKIMTAVLKTVLTKDDVVKSFCIAIIISITTVHIQMQIQGNTKHMWTQIHRWLCCSGTNRSLITWLLFFNTRRETILKSLL